MRAVVRTSRGWVAKAASAALVLAAAIGMPGQAHALMTRLASQSILLNGFAVTTATPFDSGLGGTAFYNLTLPEQVIANVLYVDVSGAGIMLGTPNALLLNCNVDGSPCDSSAAFDNTGPTGWTVVQAIESATPSLVTDNNFHYTWCIPIAPNLVHAVQLKFASLLGTPVGVEQVYVNVDAESIILVTPSIACAPGLP